jgi:CheY-like chemotaxis protein
VVVVVDDSRISLEQTRVALEGQYEVITLESGLACLKYFAVKGVPDLLIMDIDMPGMDGMVTVEKLREKKLQNLNVMFLTAIANRETVLRCNRAGAKDYILKPVNPVYLRERVRIALDRNIDR